MIDEREASRLTAIAAIIEAELGSRYTGAVVRVEHGGRCTYERAWGKTHRFAGARAIEVDTRFDVASLTKVIMATAALRLADAGLLDLDAPLGLLVPEWTGDARESITVRMLLAHTSGLASGADYRTLFGSNVVTELLGRPAVAAPGASVLYSDLGFVALGVVIERVVCRPLASWQMLFPPETFESLAFRPPGPEREAIAATEIDAWRGMVQGRVHDEKAWLMGGISGHAGMFGTARDVARVCEAYLAPLHGRACALLRAPLAQAAITEAAWDPVLRRGLGWALKTSDENSCGSRASATTFGHTGFTGTCAWSDPDRDMTVVLLTNAVHFGRRDLRAVRAAVCDAAFDAAG